MRRTIAFLADSLVDGFQTSAWAGVRRAAEVFDLDLLCFVSGYVTTVQPGRKVFELVEPSRLMGTVALSGSLGGTEAELRALFRRLGPAPVVGLGRAVEGVASFTVDNRASIAALVDHLVLVHGRRRLAFICGPPENEEARLRLEAFRASLARHGLEDDPDRILPGAFVPRSGLEAAQLLLRRGVPFDGLLAANDYMAMGAAEELARSGVAVPHDVSVAGFDDVPEAGASSPGLTTVRQPLYEMSREAVAQLVRSARGEPAPALRTFPAELVLRRSCGCGHPRRTPTPPPRALTPPPALDRGAQAAALAARLEARFPELSTQLGDAEWTVRLPAAFLDALGDGDARPFCDLLASLLKEGQAAEVEVARWQGVLDALVGGIEVMRPEETGAAAELREAGLRTLATAMEQVHKAVRIGLERGANVLRRLWELSPVDPEEVWLALQDQLPTIGVPAFFLCSFVEPEGDRARLDFHYSLTDNVALEPTREPFPARRILPGAFTTARRWGFLVMPIKARGREVGYAVCEMGRLAGPGYESLSNQLSAATELRTLLTEIRGYAIGLEAKIEARTAELHEAQRQLVDTAHRAGMAEIAVGLMHNVGNLLTSVNVSAERVLTLGEEGLRAGLLKAAELLEGPEESVLAALARDGRRELLARYIRTAAEELGRSGDAVRAEGRELLEKVALIRDTVKTLQEYALGERELSMAEPLDLRGVVETALKIQETNLSRHTIRVVRALAPTPTVLAPRAKVVHVVVNLVKNAVEAMRDAPPERRLLTLQLREAAGTVELLVNDAGVGIAPEQLLQVFRYGFTTKKDGHGFGLHSCANLVARLGGTIHAESAGPDRGATFVVRLPASA